MRFEEISCAHVLVVLHMLNLDIYSYVAEFYYRETLTATYSGCVQLEFIRIGESKMIS